MYYSITLSALILIKWQADPTVTTISTTAYPIKKVEFPAITICSQGYAKDVMDIAILKQFERFLKSKDKMKPQGKRQKRSPKSIVDSLSNEEVNEVRLYNNRTHETFIYHY